MDSDPDRAQNKGKIKHKKKKHAGKEAKLGYSNLITTKRYVTYVIG